MQKVLALSLILALAGCGGDVEPAKESTAAEIRDRTLARVKTLEEQAAKDEVKGGDVQALTVSIQYLIGHMKKQNVGTDEQLRSLTGLRQRLVQGVGGRTLPARDWRPDSGKPPPAPKIDAAPIQALLPELRSLLESIQ